MSVKTKQHHLTENDRKIHDVGAKYYSTTYLRMYPPDQLYCDKQKFKRLNMASTIPYG